MTYLRPWRMEDASDLALALNNPAIHRNLRDGLPLPYTVSDAASYIQGVLDAPKDSQYAWAIHMDGKAVGSIGFFRKENIHRFTAELGYYVAEAYWGKGLMTAAVKEGCEHLFHCTDILRIFAEPYAQNAASCRVLEKAGFQLEGTMRQNAVKNGELIDMKLYARLRDASI